MRVFNSFRNSIFGGLQSFIILLLGFISRSIFINMLGMTYNGLNGLFTNIMSMLSIAELGIGSAIVFNLYPYLNKNDTDIIKSIMRFYLIAYRFVAAFVGIFGILLIPFLGFFSDYKGIHDNVEMIFFLFVLNSVFSYLSAYKRSILYADQKNYIINISDTITKVIITVLQIISLYLFKSFAIYLIISAILTLTENIILQKIADRQYPYLRDKNIKRLSPTIRKNLFKQIYGMLYHKIGTFVVLGTDSMIITRFLGLNTMGLYANYIMVSNAISSILVQSINGIIASVGNLLTENNPKDLFNVYKKISFLCFWIFTVASIAIYIVMVPFVKIWIGEKGLLANTVLLIIVLNFYVTGMRQPIQVFQNASGIFYENRHVPLLESALNLGASLIFVHFFGLEGVLMGTLLSTMLLYGYSFPKYVYHPIFRRKTTLYVKEQLFYIMIFLFVFGISFLVGSLVNYINQLWLSFILSILISLIVPNVILLFLFRKNENFIYYSNLIKNNILRK
ncbi:MAG: oligosaccharide flippase family protein [Streptococcaceae bacterium]|nr:oligosaccharide flippase family protein [Streptococcaceae bacterium]